MINEYIKIHHQDGLVTFAGRSEAQAIWYIVTDKQKGSKYIFEAC